jgi:hypothetical protein
MWRSPAGVPKGKTEKKDRRGSTDWVRLTAAVLFFGLGAALLALAVPRGIAAITFASQSATSTLLSGGRPSPTALADSVVVIEKALRWASPAKYLSSLSLVEFELAQFFPPGSPGRPVWIGRAEQHAMAALKANPADGYTWVRLAVMRQARSASPRDILEPLLTSLDVAPNRRELWRSRMALLMFHWGELKPNELPILRHQIQTMWNVPQFQFFLYDTALKYGRKFSLIDMLGDAPGALEEIRTFDRNMASP